MGGLQCNDPEEREKRKQVAIELLGSCKLDKETVQKRFGLVEKEKEQPFSLNFKPSSETHPAPTPFTANKKVELDGMGVPNPPSNGGNEY